jgi:anti-sigma factor ChrR (cupin superfamily)
MSVDRVQLIEYLLGNLEPAARVQIENELQTSPDSQAELAELEALFGDMAMTVEPLPPKPILRQRVLASVEPTTLFEGFLDRFAELFDIRLEKARTLLEAAGAVGDQPWVESGLPGIRFLHFDGGQRVADAHCGLVHIDAGQRIPTHQHYGDEWSFILQGRLQEEPSGKIWACGELVYRPPGSAHAIHAVGTDPCLYAAVLFGEFRLSEKDY